MNNSPALPASGENVAADLLCLLTCAESAGTPVRARALQVLDRALRNDLTEPEIADWFAQYPTMIAAATADEFDLLLLADRAVQSH